MSQIGFSTDLTRSASSAAMSWRYAPFAYPSAEGRLAAVIPVGLIRSV